MNRIYLNEQIWIYVHSFVILKEELGEVGNSNFTKKGSHKLTATPNSEQRS